MSDDLQNSDELLKELDKLAIRTSQGSFVKKEDVEKLIKRRQEATAITDAEVPERMSIQEARSKAKKFLGDQAFGEQGPPEPKRSISAQPVSRP